MIVFVGARFHEGEVCFGHLRQFALLAPWSGNGGNMTWMESNGSLIVSIAFLSVISITVWVPVRPLRWRLRVDVAVDNAHQRGTVTRMYLHHPQNLQDPFILYVKKRSRTIDFDDMKYAFAQSSTEHRT